MALTEFANGDLQGADRLGTKNQENIDRLMARLANNQVTCQDLLAYLLTLAGKS